MCLRESFNSLFLHIFIDYVPWTVTLIAINVHHNVFVNEARKAKIIITVRGNIHDSCKYALKCLIDEMCNKNKANCCSIVTLDKSLLLGSVCTFTVLLRDQFLNQREKRLASNASIDSGESFRW